MSITKGNFGIVVCFAFSSLQWFGFKLKSENNFLIKTNGFYSCSI